MLPEYEYQYVAGGGNANDHYITVPSYTFSSSSTASYPSSTMWVSDGNGNYYSGGAIGGGSIAQSQVQAVAAVKPEPEKFVQFGEFQIGPMKAKPWFPGSDPAPTNYYPADKQETFGRELANTVLWHKKGELPAAFQYLDARGRHAFISVLCEVIDKLLVHPAQFPKKLHAARTCLALAHEKLAA